MMSHVDDNLENPALGDGGVHRFGCCVDTMGKKVGQKKRKSGGGGGGFQVVHEDGNAGKRASQMKVGARDSDSDDDVEAIRKANAGAAAKRQKVDEKREIKAAKKAVDMAGGGDGEGKGAKSSKGAATAAKKPAAVPFRDLTPAGSIGGKAGKKEGAVGAGGSGISKHKEAAKGSSSKSAGTKQEEEEEEVDDDDDDEDEEDDDSDDDDDEDEDGGLLMKAGAYAAQRKGGRNEFEEDSGEGSDFEELDVVFENKNPEEGDFHGIKLFLSDLLDGDVFDSSGLVDDVLALSGKVGTVVKVEDADDVMGIVSAVAMGSGTWVKQVTKFLKGRCPQAQQGKLLEALGAHGAALVVSERMANMPQEMALPLLRGLFDEVKKSKLKYESYIILTRYLVEQRRGGKGRSGGGGGGGGGEPYFVKAEDEVYGKHSTVKFDFALQRPSEESHVWRGFCCVVPASKVDAVLKGVLDLVGDLAYQNQT